MPTTQAHRDKQSITKQLLSDLQQSQDISQYADWIVTLAFYKVLHAVDSYFATLGIHPKGHGERGQRVREYLGEDIYRQYDTLYGASIIARYEEATYRDDPQRVTTLINNSLTIEEHVNTLLEADGTF